ncbi:hypothetical protein K2X05_02910 [bacterium]|nr:hypothetical protein [bacterium]
MRKTIFDLKKGVKELFFYRHLPKQQEKYFPKLLKHKKTARFISYEMELIPTYDLSALYKKGQLTKINLELLFKKIDLYWKEAPQKKIGPKQWRKLTYHLIVGKMNARWKLYQKSTAYKNLEKFFFDSERIVLNEFKTNLEEKLIFSIYQQSDYLLHITHGDLCFSNIFILDKKIKLIDPRGGSTINDFFIPISYDIAKLSQCIYGNYDGILANKEVPFKAQRLLFNKWLYSKKIDLHWIRLVESSLFLSMLPLHLDRPEVHIKMMAASIKAFRSTP